MTTTELNTTDTIPPPPPAPRHRRWWVLAVAFVGMIFGLFGIGLFFVPAQWAAPVVPGTSVVDDGAVAFRPGSARETDSRVDVEGLEVFVPDGQLLFTTVAIDNNLTVWDWIMASSSDDIDLLARELVYPDETIDESRARNAELMSSSKDGAVLVALSYLGVDALKATGVGFTSVEPDSPADGVLEPGEVIVGVNGQPITTLVELRDQLVGLAPGDTVALEIESNDGSQSRPVDLVLGQRPDDEPGGYIGVSTAERLEDADLPISININSGSVGGPSAGLAFTLTILDLLTPGELTGGQKVAVTGTIRIDGSVGPVGGVPQKAVAVGRSGATAFIVPKANVEDARRTAPEGLQIIGVDNLEEAIAALSTLGGDVNELALPADVVAELN